MFSFVRVSDAYSMHIVLPGSRSLGIVHDMRLYGPIPKLDRVN